MTPVCAQARGGKFLPQRRFDVIMFDLVPPERLTDWVPGELLYDSGNQRWGDVSVCNYRYGPQEVIVPPLRDYTLVAYTGGATRISRRVSGPWQSGNIRPGNHVSVMTRAEPSHWEWDSPIDVHHLYLTRQLLSKVCADVVGRDVADVELHDLLCADDAVLNGCVTALGDEARSANLGGKLFVDAMTTQICVHLLRRYANVSIRERQTGDGLSRIQAQLVEGYIETNLDRAITLDDLAAVAHTSTSHFLRQFKTRFGLPPHAYVIQRRVVCARHLLEKTTLPLKDVASRSGFSDQSHMTRLFQRELGVTPSAYRQANRS